MIYFIQEDGGQYGIKIGYTKGSAEGRLAELQTGNSVRLSLLACIAGEMQDEATFHSRFAALKARADGEWFHPGPDLIRFIAGLIGGSPAIQASARTAVSASPLRKAAEWLVDRFKEKRRWASQDMLSLSRVAKIHKDDLASALSLLGVGSIKGAVVEVHGGWPLLARGLDEYPRPRKARAFALLDGFIGPVVACDAGDWAAAAFTVIGQHRGRCVKYPAQQIHFVSAVPERLHPAFDLYEKYAGKFLASIIADEDGRFRAYHPASDYAGRFEKVLAGEEADLAKAISDHVYGQAMLGEEHEP